MDLVYTTQPDPLHNHAELRYSIRSMEKHLKKLGEIFIVGELPDFLTRVIHIPCENKHKHNAGRNIYEKTLAACRHPALSDHFFAAADDNFLLAPLSPKGYKYYHSGKLETLLDKLSDKTSYFKPYVRSTYEALTERRLPTWNFSVHIPIIYQKQIFIEAMESYDWDRPKKGYTIKSLYANTLKIKGDELKDNKLHSPKTMTAIARKIEGTRFVSTNEHSFNAEMIATLAALFPEPSTREMS